MNRAVARVGRATGAALVTAAITAGCAAPSDQASDDRPAVVHDSQDQHGYIGNYLNMPYEMPQATLTDTAGHPFDLEADTTKPLTLLFFGYTNCPDLCPVVLANVASALRRMPDQRDQIQLVFITTDPEHDTPKAIRTYLDRFDESFIGLTANMGVIKQATESLHVGIGPVQEQADGNITQTTEHTLSGSTPTTRDNCCGRPARP